LAASILIVAWLAGRAARRASRPIARALLAVSALSGFLPAALAIHFSMTGFERLSDDAFHRMVLFHGLVNAVGFIGAGLAGMRLSRRAR
ncbi:MAG TPA: YndJ family transporter, partial [Polyangiaceae bacterium]|nr:YndJ family transporter [Polyangiaceae bacterium]